MRWGWWRRGGAGRIHRSQYSMPTPLIDPERIKSKTDVRWIWTRGVKTDEMLLKHFVRHANHSPSSLTFITTMIWSRLECLVPITLAFIYFFFASSYFFSFSGFYWRLFRFEVSPELSVLKWGSTRKKLILLVLRFSLFVVFATDFRKCLTRQLFFFSFHKPLW